MYAKYGCFKDSWMYRRFMQVIEACNKYGVVPEIMASSHALKTDGTFVRFDDVMPKTTNAMHECFKQKLININAHGMIHINASTYLETGAIDAREFLGLDEEETREHLLMNIKFIREVFGKEPLGFVAPAWGYQSGVTKKVASEYFFYIADSYDHWKQGACMDFGAVDKEHGFIHFPETWRYGRYNSGPSIVKYWEDVLGQFDLVHMMQHGYRIPGKWKAILTINPAKAINHLLYGNLSGIFKAAMHVGIEWGTLENEALQSGHAFKKRND